VIVGERRLRWCSALTSTEVSLGFKTDVVDTKGATEERKAGNGHVNLHGVDSSVYRWGKLMEKPACLPLTPRSTTWCSNQLSYASKILLPNTRKLRGLSNRQQGQVGQKKTLGTANRHKTSQSPGARLSGFCSSFFLLDLQGNTNGKFSPIGAESRTRTEATFRHVSCAKVRPWATSDDISGVETP
jgi:hypothetical protein